jgi:hypothetical protein
MSFKQAFNFWKAHYTNFEMSKMLANLSIYKEELKNKIKEKDIELNDDDIFLYKSLIFSVVDEIERRSNLYYERIKNVSN